MRAAALSWTLLASALAGCTLAFPLDDLQDGDGAGAGSSTPSSSVSNPTTSSGGAGQGGASTGTGGAGTGAVPTYEDAVLADGPVLYLRMSASTDEPNLGTNPLVSAPHQGPHNLTAAVVPGGDQATTYDDPTHDLNQTGEDDTGRLEVPALTGFFQENQPFSLEIWARLPVENVVENADLFRSDDANGGVRLRLDARFVMDGTDKVSFGFRDGATMNFDAYNSFCNFDDWTDASARYFVATYDPTQTHTLALYVDGVRCDTAATQSDGAITFPSFDASMLLGNGWSGAIDEVAVYDSVLPLATICAHFEAGGGTCN
jgi:hypothetical protein